MIMNNNKFIKLIIVLIGIFFISNKNVLAAFSDAECNGIVTGGGGKSECLSEPYCEWSNSKGCYYVNPALQTEEGKQESNRLNCGQYSKSTCDVVVGCSFDWQTNKCIYAPNETGITIPPPSNITKPVDDETPPVAANFCSDIKPGIKILGYIILVFKVLVPVIIIIMGTKDIYNVVTTGKSDDLKKQFILLGKRVIAGLIIFFLPTIINVVINAVDPNSESDYKVCTTCLFDPTNCN